MSLNYRLLNMFIQIYTESIINSVEEMVAVISVFIVHYNLIDLN